MLKEISDAFITDFLCHICDELFDEDRHDLWLGLRFKPEVCILLFIDHGLIDLVEEALSIVLINPQICLLAERAPRELKEFSFKLLLVIGQISSALPLELSIVAEGLGLTLFT